MSSNMPESTATCGNIETESTVDGIVAPLFFAVLGGAPALWAYKAINTLDSMVGHREAPYTRFGWTAARLDDVLNWIPARISAFLIVFAALIYRKNTRKAWQILWRDHALTASPNAGWPMSAAAGALEVKFIKSGHYTLGDPVKPLVPETIDSAVNLVTVAGTTWFLILILVEVLSLAF